MIYNSEFTDILLPNENLLWSGIPEQGFRFDAKSLFLSAFGLFFFGFAIFLTTIAASMGDMLFGLFCLPFLLIGFYFTIGQHFWNKFTRQHTFYGITEQRIIIIEGGFSRTTNTIFIKDLPNVQLEQEKEGRGTLIFGDDVRVGYGKKARTHLAPRFIGIENVTTVYQLVMQRKAKQ